MHYAFQELGKVVRSAYLLKYLRKPELRRTVNHATTVSERLNDFIPFVTFGNRGTIASSFCDEQRKIIKYGHLVANILIFMNVHDQSIIMNELIQEGHVITKVQAASLAPYRKSNINRLGAYFLDVLRDALNIDYRLQVVSLSNRTHRQYVAFNFLCCVILLELVPHLYRESWARRGEPVSQTDTKTTGNLIKTT